MSLQFYIDGININPFIVWKVRLVIEILLSMSTLYVLLLTFTNDALRQTIMRWIYGALIVAWTPVVGWIHLIVFLNFLLFISDKNNQRPQRKAYGRLSIEDDSNLDMLSRTESLDNLDNFNKNSSTNSSIDKYSNENVSNVDSEYQIDRNSRNKLSSLSESNFNRLAMAISDDDEYGKCKSIWPKFHSAFLFVIMYLEGISQMTQVWHSLFSRI